MNRSLWHFGFLLLLYMAFLLNGALYPFHGWQIPHDSVLKILCFQWVKYIFIFDIIQNLLMFLPFGCFAACYLIVQKRSLKAVLLLPIIASFLFSLFIEISQAYNPARLPSLLDLCLNTISGTVGVIFALPLMHFYSKINYFVKYSLYPSSKQNLWPIFGLCVWLIWACYQMFPFIPTLHPSQLLNSVKPIILFLKGEFNFEFSSFALHALQGTMLYFSGKLFLKPSSFLIIFLLYISLVILGITTTMNHVLSIEAFLGYVCPMIIIVLSQKMVNYYQSSVQLTPIID